MAKDKWEVDSMDRGSTDGTTVTVILLGKSSEEAVRIADEINKSPEEQKRIYLKAKEKGGKWEETCLELLPHPSSPITRIIRGIKEEELELAKEGLRPLTIDEKRKRKAEMLYEVSLLIDTGESKEEGRATINLALSIKSDGVRDTGPWREGEVFVYIK